MGDKLQTLVNFFERQNHLHTRCHHLQPPFDQFLFYFNPSISSWLLSLADRSIRGFISPFLQSSDHRRSANCGSSAELPYDLLQRCLHAAPRTLSPKSLLRRLCTTGTSSAGAHCWSGTSRPHTLHFTLAIWSTFPCGGQAETDIGASASSLSQQSNYGDI